MFFKDDKALKKLKLIALAIGFFVFAACSKSGVVAKSNPLQTPKKVGIAEAQTDTVQLNKDFVCKINVSETDAKRIRTSLSNILTFGFASFEFMIEGREKAIASIETKPGIFEASYKIGSSGIEKKKDKIYCLPTLNYKTISVKVDATSPVEISDAAPELKLSSGKLINTSLTANSIFNTIVFEASDSDNDAVTFVATHTCGDSIQTVTTGTKLTISGTMPNMQTCSIEVFAKADGVLSTSQTLVLTKLTSLNEPQSTVQNTPTTPSSNSNLNISVAGSNIVEYKYALKTDWTPCSASDTFSAQWISASTPITDVLSTNAEYRVCIIGRDSQGVAQSPENATTQTWVYTTGIYPLAALANTPLSTSSANMLNTTVSGLGIAEYQYAVITSGTCAAATYNGTWIPKQTPISSALGSDGSYTLCVRARDANGTAQQLADVTSYTWVKDATPPNASDITLSGAPSSPSSAAALDVTIGGTGVLKYRYAIINQSATCSSAIFSTAIAVATHITDTLGADGNLRLCVVGIDSLENETTPTNAKVHDWTKDSTSITALLSGAPSTVSNATALNVTVSGTDVVSYKFSIITAGTCAAATYSASWVDISTPITEAVGADNSYTLCVVGQNATSTAQLASAATTSSWTQDTVAPTTGEILLSGTPNQPSNVTTLDVTVSGTQVSTYKYALVTQSTACSAATYSATWIDVATHITDTLGADGNLRLCVRGRDAAGNSTTAANAKQFDWTKNTTAALATISNQPTTTSSATSLNVTVGGTNIDSYKYAVIISGTCTTATYSASWINVATVITSALGADGNHTLCVIGKNTAGTQQAVASATSYAWNKDTVAPVVASLSLSGTPAALSNATSLNISVSGSDAVSYKFSVTTQATSCAAASYSASWITIATAITDTLGADGALRICVIARDAANNEVAVANAKQYDWTKNTAAAVATVSNAPTGVSATTSLNVSVAGTNIVSYKYALLTSGSCDAATYNATWILIATNITDTIGADGSRTLCVIGKNNAGTEQATNSASTASWTKDTTAPTSSDITLSGTPADPSSNSSLNVTVGGSGVTHYKHVVTNQSTACSAATYPSSWIAVATAITDALGGDGAFRLCVIGQDAAGNATTPANAKQYDWTKNTAVVSATLSGAPTGQSNATSLNVTVSGNDVVSYQYSVITSGNCAGATYNGSWIGVATHITDALGADGNFTLCVIGRNSINTSQSASAATTEAWVKDTTAPTAAEISLSGTPTNPSSTTSLNISVSGTGVVNYKYALTTQATACSAATYSGSWISVATHITDTLGADGNLRLCVIGQDDANNATAIGSAKQSDWTKDTAAPVAGDVSFTNPPSSLNNATSIDVTVTGVTNYKYALTTQATACSAATYSSSWIAIATHITETLGSDGNLRLCVIGQDAAGNGATTTQAQFVDWTKDTAAPIAADVTLTGTPADPSNVTSLDVTIGGTGIATYQYAMTTSATACTAASYNGSWIAVATHITDSTGADADKKRLCVITQDTAGNSQTTANAKSYDWVKDTVIPTSAVTSLSGTPSATSLAENIDVTVGGTNIAFYKFAIITSGGCAAATYSSSWVAVATHITESLGADDSYTLCVIGRDTALNDQLVSDATSYAWVKDTAKPIASNITLTGSPADPSGSTSYNITISGTDVASYQYALTTNSTACTVASYNGTWILVATNITDSTGADANKKRLCVIAKDVAGNAMISASDAAKYYDWLKDTTNPVAADVTLSGTPADPSNTSTLNVTVAASGSWVGSNITTYQYAVTTSATACSAATYNGSWVAVATAITASIGVDANKKRLCVITKDAVGNTQTAANGKSYDWVQDTVAPVTADISVTNSPAIDTETLNVIVGGTSIESYKYKFDSTGATSCSSATGYSASWISVSTAITDSVGANGSKRLCIVAKDAAGNGATVSGTSAKQIDWTTTIIPPPTSIAVWNYATGKVELSWNPVTSASSYNLYWATSAGVTKSSTKISSIASTSYSHTGRTNGTTYYYRVTAVVGGVESAVSPVEASATPSSTVVLSGPICFNENVKARVDDASSNTYFGGYFDAAGKCLGFGAPMDLSTGMLAVSKATLDQPNDGVYAVASDGNGGWYIGGNFTKVGSTTRNRLAHILSDGSVDPSFNPNVNDQIFALDFDGTNIYFGGSFTTVGGTTRNKIAAVNTSGTLQSWNPNVNGQISAIQVSGTNVYFSGSFTTVGGTTRNKIALVNTSGTLQSWNPNVTGGSVKAIAISGSVIYFGGSFTAVGGTTRNNAAAVNTSGTLQSWDPNAESWVNALAVSGSNIYMGGNFDTIGGTARLKLAAVNTSGTLQSWNPSANGSVNGLTISGSNIYISGSFSTIASNTRNGLAVINTSGTLQSLNPNIGIGSLSGASATAIDGNTIYVAGGFRAVAGVDRGYMAAVDSTGNLLSWNPNTNHNVYNMAISGSNIYFGGQFTTVGGTTRNRLAAVSTSGTLQTWNPDSNGTVRAMKISGSILYIGGGFSTIGGTTRNNLAAINTSGTLQSWNPNASSTVNSMILSGSTIYIGGQFTTIGATTRNRFAAIDTSGTLLSLNPNFNDNVESIDISGSIIYAGGSFTTIGGSTTRNYAAAFNTSGTVQSWNPDVGSIVRSVAVSGTNVYFGGQFNDVGGTTRMYVAAVSTSGTLQSWAPAYSYVPWGLTFYNGGVFYGIGFAPL